MVEKRAIFPLLLLVAGVMCRSGQPNVLLIIVDDLRPALGCYSDLLAFTPHIDAIASQGTVFTRAYAQQALCGPSRTSFLTSRRPDTTRLYDVHSYWRTHAGNFTTLPQYFKEHGYHTAAAGKVFHPGIVSNHSDDQPYSWSETPFHPPTQAHKQDPVCLGLDGALHTNIYCPVQVEEQPGGSLPDIETTRHSTAWLQEWAERGATRPSQQTPTQPFFLAVGYHKPHIPLKFPKEFLELFPISSVPLAPNRWLPKGLPSVAWNPWNDLRSREDIAALNVSFPYGPVPDYYARYIRQGYYAATSYTDSLIGDLLATVDRLFPDTIVALIGDHGWSLGEHQEWSKFSNFEVSTRVPFIIRNWRRAHTDVHFTAPHPGSPPSHLDTSLPHAGTPSLPHTYTMPPHTHSSLPYQHPQRRMPQKPPPRNRLTRSTAGKGMEYNGLVELVDLFPTLVDLAGLPAIPQCPSDSHKVEVCTEGVSLSHIINTNPHKINRHAGNVNASHRRDGDKAVDSRNVESNAILSFLTNFDHMSKFSLSEASKQNAETSDINNDNAHESRLKEAEILVLESLQRKEHMTDSSKSEEKYDMPLMIGEEIAALSKLEEAGTHKQESIPGTGVAAASPKSAEKSITPRIVEKKAAFSQYPRPGPTPSRDPDSDQPHTRDTTIMGYSVRTDRFRFTAWLKFNNVTYRPDWDHIVAEELYDHKIDPSEDHNVVGKRSYAHKRKVLYSVLRGGWRSAVRWR